MGNDQQQFAHSEWKDRSNIPTRTFPDPSRAVKTDVFEVLYQKPSSTRSSTQSEHTASHQGNNGRASQSPMRHPEFDGNTYRKPKARMDKWRQQEVHDDEDRKVLVGQNYLVDRDKWNDNQFIKFDTQQRRLKKQTSSPGPDEMEDMKYRTFSKRTFRPDFVDPTDNRSLVWFVEAGQEGEGDRPKREYTGPPVRLFSRKPVTRSNTFRMENDGDSEERMGNRHSLNEPIRVEIKPSDQGVKVVPVGVATPYNSHRNGIMSKKSSSFDATGHSSMYSSNGPIKIIIDPHNSHSNSNQSPMIRDRGSPPPPYTSKNTQRSPQRTFSSSTVVIGSDDNNKKTKKTVTLNEFHQRNERKSGYEDVLSAVRAPNGYRQYNGSAALNNQYQSPGQMAGKGKPLFVSSVKVKPHRPAWR